MPGQSLRSYGSRWSGALNATIDATGAATAYFGPVPDGRRWTIDLIVLSSVGTGGSCALYQGDALPQNSRGGSSTPSSDTWQGSLSLESSEVLTIVWSGMPAGTLVTVNLHFADDQIVLVGDDKTLLGFGR